jgi:DNA-nicking Smr family endonuclease
LSDGRKKPPSRRLLTREELALWRHVVADVRPRAGRKPPVDELPAVRAPDAPAQAPAAPAAPPSLEPPARRAKNLPPLAPIEKKLRRRLASGREEIDARIDLHGMTQAQAHHALTGFIHAAAARGDRVVLVITGKGGPGGEARDPHAERGVLRRAAPLWLREPALRPLVLSIEEAARPHGGGGAFYVRLRRRRQG